MILGIVYQLDVEFVRQIVKALVFVAGDDNDLRHAGLLKLADLPLDQHLAPHRDECLRHLVGERSKSTGSTCRHNNSVINFICHIKPSIVNLRTAGQNFDDRSLSLSIPDVVVNRVPVDI